MFDFTVNPHPLQGIGVLANGILCKFALDRLNVMWVKWENVNTVT
jgi:hypothetical protein